MGLERVASIVQKVPNNYDTDVFRLLFEAIQKDTNFPQAYGGKVGKDDPDNVDMAYRVWTLLFLSPTFAFSIFPCSFFSFFFSCEF